MNCIFCHKEQNEVSLLLKYKNDSFICDNCIRDLHELLTNYSLIQDSTKNKIVDVKYPHELKNELDKYVVGQDKAKIFLCSEAYTHFRRFNSYNEDNFINKNNFLLIGPTGVGKTLLATKLAEILNIPYVIANATSLTEAGYVGEDVEHMLLMLLEKCNNNTQTASRGIIIIDEIDKICRSPENRFAGRDISGEGVQQSLLKIIEGTTVELHNEQTHQHYLLNTKNIWFICCGTFVGIEKIIGDKYGDSAKNVFPDECIQFGMIPELMGRLPVIVQLDKLSINDYYNILIQPIDSIISLYKNLFMLDGIELHFDPDVLHSIANIAFNFGTGARSLRAVLDDFMLPLRFHTLSQKGLKKLRITKHIFKKYSNFI